MPVLLETFVDTAHYTETCYQASNWIDLGLTAGRGRMDRYNERALSRKRIFVYPLQPGFRAQLCSLPNRNSMWKTPEDEMAGRERAVEETLNVFRIVN